MIAHLSGTLLRKSPSELVVDVAGVGYRVLIPVSTFYRLGEEGARVSLRIHTQLREDALQLFGFADEREQALFERLIEVAGVGPKLAVNILSGIEAEDLAEALRGGDVARLTRVPGVGKKTAERLVLELRDRVARFLPAPVAPQPVSGNGLRDDLLSALANLGYSRAEAERGITRALQEDAAGAFEDLLRRSLQVISGR